MKRENTLQPSQFLRFFLVSCILGAVIVVLYLAIANPYGVSPLQTEWTGANYFKPARINTCRLVKAYDLNFKKQVDAVVVGQSRVAWGFDPAYYNDTRKKILYNGGLPGSPACEHFCYVAGWSRQMPTLKKVYLEINDFGFHSVAVPPKDYQESRVGRTFYQSNDFAYLFFSASAIADSFKTFSFNTTPFAPGNPPKLYDIGDGQHHLPSVPVGEWLYYNMQERPFALPYQRNELYFKQYRLFVEYCREQNIELIPFTSAETAIWSERNFMQDNQKTVNEFYREMATIHPFYFFTGFSAVNRDINNFWDETHWKPAVGNMMLDVMDGIAAPNKSETFGIKVTADNVEQMLVMLQAEERDWAQTNPSTINKLRTALEAKKGVALPVKAWEASSFSPKNPPSAMFDGKPYSGTPWLAALRDNQQEEWVIADLADESETVAVQFSPGTVLEYFPKEFVIETSNDKQDWVLLCEEKDCKPYKFVWYQTLTGHRKFRYVRIRMKTNFHRTVNKWSLQINELQVIAPKK